MSIVSQSHHLFSQAAYEETIRLLEPHCKKEQNDTEAKELLAASYYALADAYGAVAYDQIKRGIALYSDLMERFPKNSEYQACRGHLYKRIHKFQQALDDFDGAQRKKYPHDLTGIILYLFFKIAPKDPEKCAQKVKEYLARREDAKVIWPQYHYYQARAQAATPKEALANIAKITQEELTALPHVERKVKNAKAQAYFNQRQFETVKKEIEPLLQQNLTDIKFFVMHWRCLIAEGKSAEVIRHTTEVIERLKIQTPHLDDCYRCRLWAFLRQGKEQEAAKDNLTRIILERHRFDPKFKELMDVRLQQETIRTINEKHGKEPEYQELLFAYHFLKKDFKQALEHVKLAKKRRLPMKSYLFVGIAYHHTKNYEIAARFYHNLLHNFYDLNLVRFYFAETGAKQRCTLGAQGFLIDLIASEKDPCLLDRARNLLDEIKQAQTHFLPLPKESIPAEKPRPHTPPPVIEEEQSDSEPDEPLLQMPETKAPFQADDWLKELIDGDEFNRKMRLEEHAHKEAQRNARDLEKTLEEKISRSQAFERKLAEEKPHTVASRSLQDPNIAYCKALIAREVVQPLKKAATPKQVKPSIIPKEELVQLEEEFQAPTPSSLDSWVLILKPSDEALLNQALQYINQIEKDLKGEKTLETQKALLYELRALFTLLSHSDIRPFLDTSVMKSKEILHFKVTLFEKAAFMAPNQLFAFAHFLVSARLHDKVAAVLKAKTLPKVRKPIAISHVQLYLEYDLVRFKKLPPAEKKQFYFDRLKNELQDLATFLLSFNQPAIKQSQKLLEESLEALKRECGVIVPPTIFAGVLQDHTLASYTSITFDEYERTYWSWKRAVKATPG